MQFTRSQAGPGAALRCPPLLSRLARGRSDRRDPQSVLSCGSSDGEALGWRAPSARHVVRGLLGEELGVGRPSDFDPRGSPPGLARTVPPFVGRKQELDRLAQWFVEAVSGRPRVVLIQGEAGIGKTRLLQEVRSIAGRLQMQICFSRCYEDVALPYLPFIESLLPEVERVAEAEKILGADLHVVRRLLHGAGPPAGVSRLTRSDNVDLDKLQLFVAVAHGTCALARTRPAIFIVDDLHWADSHSLDLFEHLAFAVAETAFREPIPLVIVGTYRPMDPGERLTRLTARLQREEMCRSFALSGLDELEIRDLIGGLGLRRPSQQLTATVSEATQGNPLFIQEVLHHLVEQDALQEQGGYLVAKAAPSDLRLPEQVTGAIVSRAQGLSEDCRKALTLASFVGDRFTVETLRLVSDIPEDALLGLLEEGARQRLVRSEGQSFQFTHPLIRHVFYHEPSVARRQRIHRQIAESLERLYADSPDTHLLEIAHHLVHAGSAAPAEVVVEYARRAADHALAVFAWSEAARYYEAALSAAQSTGRLSATDRASLHYRAGLAHYHDRDVGPCLHNYEKAIEGYRVTGDTEGLAQALMEKTRTQLTLAAVPLGALVDIQPLEDILTALGDREPGLRGRLLAMVAEAYRHGRQAEKAKERAQQALEIAQRLGDDHLSANASFALGLSHTNDLALEEALVGYQNARDYARRAGDSIREGWALHRTPVPLTLLGRLDEAQAVALEACEVTRRSHDWGNHSLGLSHLACVAVARGHFVASEERALETLLMSRSRYPWGGFRSLLALACARGLRGAWTEAEDALDVLVEPGRVFEQAGPT
ncbi:MAG: ATP-binding protein, partial [Candidatus Rokuibacteriota bacterium]